MFGLMHMKMSWLQLICFELSMNDESDYVMFYFSWIIK